MTRMRLFWSIYCILVGIELLIKIIFKLDFSGFAVAFAILMLESGIFLITGGFGMNKTRYASGGGDYFFFNGSIVADAQEELTIAFSNAVVDFSTPPAPLTRVTCLFGNTTVRLPQGYSVRTVCSAAFGDVVTPNGSVPGFGDRVFVLGDGLQIQLEVKSVFGHVTVQD